MIRFFSRLSLGLGLISLLACQNSQNNQTTDPQTQTETAKPAALNSIEAFWPKFQEAVKTGKEACLPLVKMPLEGADFVNESFDGKPLDKDNFLNHFSKLFDAATIEKIGSTKAGELEKEGQTYRLSVFSVHGEGANKTESAIMFNFGLDGDSFKLLSVDIAG